MAVHNLSLTSFFQRALDPIIGVGMLLVCALEFNEPFPSDRLILMVAAFFISTTIHQYIDPYTMCSSRRVCADTRDTILDGCMTAILLMLLRTAILLGQNYDQAPKNVPRLTPHKTFLRHSLLNELPQLVNVSKARISIVGPRPQAVAHNEMYRKLIKRYMLRQEVKLRITTRTQVNGPCGETSTLDKIRAHEQYDLNYLCNLSSWPDLRILINPRKSRSQT